MKAVMSVRVYEEDGQDAPIDHPGIQLSSDRANSSMIELRVGKKRYLVCATELAEAAKRTSYLPR